MEQKINITKYMIDSVKEIEKALESCQKSIVEIKDRKSHAKAVFDWSVAKGIVTGCYFVVNNLEDCNFKKKPLQRLDEKNQGIGFHQN